MAHGKRRVDASNYQQRPTENRAKYRSLEEPQAWNLEHTSVKEIKTLTSV